MIGVGPDPSLLPSHGLVRVLHILPTFYVPTSALSLVD